MTDNQSKITPYKPPPNYGALKKVPQKPVSAAGSLQARLAAAKKEQAQVESRVGEMPNRLCLLLDVSGSMSDDKIQKLREATEGFVNSLNMNGSSADTSLACRTFPYEESVRVSNYPLTCDQQRARLAAYSLQTCGCTPMGEAMEWALENLAMTRAILMSDGRPDSESRVRVCASQYREAGIPIDTVHIGDDDPSGEVILKEVAELTGGLYIKFTNVAYFAKNFKYLSPGLRQLMLTGGVSASELGATEIKGQTGGPR